VHRQLALSIPTLYGQVTAAAAVGFELAAVLLQQLLELLRIHEYGVFHTSVEVNRSVELPRATRRSRMSKYRSRLFRSLRGNIVLIIDEIGPVGRKMDVHGVLR
jgi:hypothetical protein